MFSRKTMPEEGGAASDYQMADDRPPHPRDVSIPEHPIDRWYSNRATENISTRDEEEEIANRDDVK